jgi:hypothetical protein
MDFIMHLGRFQLDADWSNFVFGQSTETMTKMMYRDLMWAACDCMEHALRPIAARLQSSFVVLVTWAL